MSKESKFSEFIGRLINMVEGDLPPRVRKFYKQYFLFRPVIWLIQFILGAGFYYLFVGLFVGVPILLYYLLGYSFPTIHIDYIITNTLRVFLIWGLIAGLYFLAKMNYFEKYQSNRYITKKDFFFQIVIIVLIVMVISCLFEVFHISARILNSYFNKFRIERTIVTFLILFIPIMTGVYTSYKKIKKENFKRFKDELKKEEDEAKREEEAKKRLEQEIDKIMKKYTKDENVPPSNLPG